MKNSLTKLFVLNVLIWLILLVMFYLAAFLSGYGSNSNYLPMEKNLFLKFIVFHFAISLYFLYRFKQLNFIGFIASAVLIAFLYLIAAWQFQYFN